MEQQENAVIGSGAIPESVARRFLETDASVLTEEVSLDSISEAVEPSTMEDILYSVAELAAKGELTTGSLVEAFRVGPPIEDVRLILLLRLMAVEEPGKSMSQSLLETFVDLGLGPIAEEAIEVTAIMGASEESALASVEGALPAVQPSFEGGRVEPAPVVTTVDAVSQYPEEPVPPDEGGGDEGVDGDELSIELGAVDVGRSEGTPTP